MLFNSIEFAIFLIIVFLLYWRFSKKVGIQNLFLLGASYFFYSWWNWKFLSLVLLCSITNYVAGIFLMKTDDEKRRKVILTVCCLISIGVLGVFKYYDFFVQAFVDAFSAFGVSLHARALHLILPVGISFYTFHTLSYTIDVYRKKFEPTRDVVSFFLFVSIFPLAMAGPIERASNVLPQIYKPRTFDYQQTVDGMRQILWGLFKKVVIADNCAIFVNQTFASYQTETGSTLMLGAIFFTFQIYCDFSGYSDMALGIGKLLGFKFIRNFSNPYFSRDIAEFWRRWHISLTTWFRDYLYIPLGGSRVAQWKIIRNTFIIFLVSGFWHGANWTFIVWGAFHALLFLPLILLKKNRKNLDTIAEGKLLPGVKELFQMGITFFLVVIGWIFFRAETLQDAFAYCGGLWQWGTLRAIGRFFMYREGWLILLMLAVEWIQRDKQHGLQIDAIKYPLVRWAIYYSIIGIIALFAASKTTFIYFQF
jgi:D-alanyl-lipoteichoic acid acyltransferase DltB (MBOAT superfamily)